MRCKLPVLSLREATLTPETIAEAVASLIEMGKQNADQWEDWAIEVYVEVLEAIADGRATDVVGCAKAALKLLEFDPDETESERN